MYRWISRILSNRAVSMALVAIGLVAMSGFFYVAVERPPPIGREGALAYGLNRQTGVEMLAVLLGYSMGLGGLYLVYSSRKYSHNPSAATLNLVSGCALLVLSLLLLSSMYAIKIGY